MASFGGDITEITFNSASVGNGAFFPKANEDSTFDPGGFRIDDDADSVSGDGAGIYKKNRKRWSFEVLCAMDMNSREDAEKVNALAAANEEADWTITSVNGTVYAGKGYPVGDINWNGNAATFTVKVSGGGRMTKIVG